MDLGPCIESQGGMFPTGTLAMEHHHFSRSFYLHIDLQHSTHCDLLEYIYIYNTDTHIYTGDGAGVFSSLHICAKPRTNKTHAGPSKQLLELNQTGHFMFWIWLVVSKSTSQLKNPPASHVSGPRWWLWWALFSNIPQRGTAFSCLMVEIPTVDGEA